MGPTEPDFASAALRHVSDAEELLRNERKTSIDQAWHLGGFAHECARKACISDSWVPKLLGHDFSSASDEAIETAIALDPRAGWLPVRNWSARYPAVALWRPDHRYERTGSTRAAADRKAHDLVAQARTAVDACVVALFINGSLAMESVQ